MHDTAAGCTTALRADGAIRRPRLGKGRTRIRGRRAERTLAALVLCCVCGMAIGQVERATRIDGSSLPRLPKGAIVHKSVRAVPHGEDTVILFSEGGIVLPTAGLLTAAAGTVDLRCRTPQDWPAEEDQAVFHVGEKGHVHVTLLFRDGGLLAVYKGGEPHFASLRFGAARQWKPNTWHRVQFTWQAKGKEVDFLLRIDGELVGMAVGRLIEEWPDRCYVGERRGKDPWKGLMDDIVLSPEPFQPPQLVPGERIITVSADRPVDECYSFWTVGNVNKPHRFLDERYRRALATNRPFVRAANAVYLLGGRYEDKNCWFLGVGPDGRVRTDFKDMIAQLKAMQDSGYVPWIVLDNVPYNMSDPPQPNTYGNTAPPKDERVWHRYVQAAVQAMVDAFGRRAVESWWFRVGTEPDLKPAHWAGTKEEYLRHYDFTVDAVTRVLPDARIGPGNILNPAASEVGLILRDQWGLDIIDHAAVGVNACTGEKGTRMTWFSCSWYARVGGPPRNFDHAIEAVRERLNRYPQFADVPILVGEFAVLIDESGRRLWGGDTTEWSASFYAALADRVYVQNVREVYEWNQATMGVWHPRTQVIGMLDRMVGGQRLGVEVKGESAAQCGAVAVRKNGELFILLYNHRRWRRPKVEETVHLTVADARMKAGQTWRLSEWLVDADHSVWVYAYDADCAEAGIKRLEKAAPYEGSTELYYGPRGTALFRKNIAKYRKLAELTQTRRDHPLVVQDGRANLDMVMPGHSVRLLVLSPGQP